MANLSSSSPESPAQPATPSAAPSTEAAASAPAREARGAPNRTAAAAFAIIAGLVTLMALTVAYVEPRLAPLMAPVAVLVGASALWGASRVDYARVRAQSDRLAEENLRLARRLESLSDTAWELRESEERYRSLIDAQGDLVVRRDRDGKVTFVNPAFAAAFGLNLSQVIGEPLALAPLEEATSDELAAGARDVEARDIRLQTIGGPRWYAWVDIRVRDDTGTLGPVCSVARDITARKEVEQALVDARRKAEAASQAKSRFLATVSHEFRTPLNGILGLAGLILETELTPDQETYARGVQSSGEALLALIDDMLDFSKIEAGRLDLHPEPTDIEATLQEIAELLAARAHGKGIDIAVDIAADLPAKVLVDERRLRQVLLNLAGNGVKFTETGGVTLAAAPVEGGEGGGRRILVTVSDTGPGIAPEEAARIFDEFEQVDSALTRRHGGAGLGLAISRRIVRHMGGDIAFAPRPGGGATFSFALDLPVVAGAETTSDELTGRRLLVVAPDGAEPEVLAAELGRVGGEARVVTTVNEAVGLVGAATAAALAYDAVLIDSRVAPSPMAALQRLREAAGGSLAAAVIVEPGERARIEALREAGFDAYLVRPVRRASLRRIAAEIIASTGDFRMDPNDARPRRAQAPRRAATSLDVLLAEDNEINALLARAVLEGLGHSVKEVRNGAAAVAAVNEHQGGFAVILMDLHMPGIDGVAAARAIREFEEKTGRPRAAILALTADVLADTRAEAEKAGIDAILEKPVAPDALRHAIAELAAA